MPARQLPADHRERMQRARVALEGLSVGDAFGECFFVTEEIVLERVQERRMPPLPWFYTDDTAMGISVYRCLEAKGGIGQDYLARLFTEEYERDWSRGYGATAQAILRSMMRGAPWRRAAGGAFSGMGSMGNGGAMRVAPVGAYFAGDTQAIVEHARASAEVTHTHLEGQNGAIAVALAVGWASAANGSPEKMAERAFFDYVLEHLPEGETRVGVARAATVSPTTPPRVVAAMLGNGSQLTSADTVPFVLSCAARFPGSYEDALWATVSAMGDSDTTCAMVGGIVALSAGRESIPAEWIAARERISVE